MHRTRVSLTNGSSVMLLIRIISNYCKYTYRRRFIFRFFVASQSSRIFIYQRLYFRLYAYRAISCAIANLIIREYGSNGEITNIRE